MILSNLDDKQFTNYLTEIIYEGQRHTTFISINIHSKHRL